MPQLARHLITLDNGHEVGVAVCGRGVPLVVVHGFSAEGILYAQTLSRIVSLGFKVVAIDVAGHGATLGLPRRRDAQQLHRVARQGAQPSRRREGRARRTLDGRSPRHRARGEPHRSGDRRHAARCDRRRHVGPDGQPLPHLSAAARRYRRGARGRHAHDDPAVPRPRAGAQARPPRRADDARSPAPTMAIGRAGDLDHAVEGKSMDARTPRAGARAGVRHPRRPRHGGADRDGPLGGTARPR